MTTGARRVSGKGKWSAVVRTAAILTGTVLLAGAAVRRGEPASAPPRRRITSGRTARNVHGGSRG